MRTSAQPSSFPLARAGEMFLVDQRSQRVSECYSWLSLPSLTVVQTWVIGLALTAPAVCLSPPGV